MVGEAVLNSLQAVGIRVRMRTMERAAFLSLWREKKLQGLLVTAVGTSGNAATRAEVFICSQGAYAHGGYPDIDTLCQQQAGERNRTRREALLHRIQQLTVERVMFAPIMDFRALVGLGPRIAEHALDRIPLHAFPAWEDVQLKGKPVRVASQPPILAGAEQSTAAGKAVEEVARSVIPVSDQSALVILDGVVTPQRLQRKVSGYRNVPNIIGFSVQSAPQKTIKELAAAGWYSDRLLSVTTVEALKEAGQSVGVPIEVVRAPGRGAFHSIVVAPRRLPDRAAEALSQVFRQMPNPAPRPQEQQ
jgi:hypothetical protein